MDPDRFVSRPGSRAIDSPNERVIGSRPEGSDDAMKAFARSFLAARPEYEGVTATKDASTPFTWSFSREGVGPGTTRHELLHRLQDQAKLTGDLSGLDPQSKLAVLLECQASPTLQGLGDVMSESAAHTAQARDLLGQLQGLGQFWFDPGKHLLYDRQFGQYGLAPRLVYHGLPYVGVPAAFGVGGYALARQDQ